LHPIVIKHPLSGRKCLFVNPQFTTRIDGLTQTESDALLNGLYTHCQQPEFQCRVRWQAGDVTMWDNRATWHKAIKVKCGDCPIKYRAVCSRCDDDEINLLEHIKVYRTFEAGQPILWRGDDLTYLGSLVYGVATISKTLEDGRTQMVGLLLPSDFIGRPGRASIEFDVTAITDVRGKSSPVSSKCWWCGKVWTASPERRLSWLYRSHGRRSRITSASRLKP